MKKGSYLSYEFFEEIEHKSLLAAFLNKAMYELHLARMLVAPTSYRSDERFEEKGMNVENAMRFYQTCLFEVYAHSLIPKLEDWLKFIQEYLSDFNGSWEYYARSRRLRLINEWGGDDCDYNNDGSIKTDVDIEVLKNYSVIDRLVADDLKDIAAQTKPEDLNFIYDCIGANGSFSIQDMFKAMGAGDIKSYRQENGRMIENTKEDELLHSISSQDSSESKASLLYEITYIMESTVKEIKNLPRDENNIEYLKSLHTRICNLLNFNLKDELEALASSTKKSSQTKNI